MIDSAVQTETLVSASRLIAASRSTTEIIALATEALCTITGAQRAQFIDPSVPLSAVTPASDAASDGRHSYEVRGHGRMLGRFELVFAPGKDREGDVHRETIELISMVTGTALALAGSTVAAPDPHPDRRTPPRGDRRKMDRDFIDHSRNGQVGFVVLRVLCDPTSARHEEMILTVASLIDQAIRQNDVTYVSGPSELSILLPGASKPEAAMAADRIRAHLQTQWLRAGFGLGDPVDGGEPEPFRLIGGVSAGRFEDPQRLAERALDALDEAILVGPNAIVTDLGA